jgi:hypothetical protein
MDTIQKFTMLLWQDFINLLHLFDGHSSDDHIRKYSKEIRENGIISIGNYLDESFCDQLRNEIEGFAADYPESVVLENGTEITHRNSKDATGADHGMIDIKYTERSIKSVSSVDQTPLIKILESASNQEVIAVRVNAYVNVGVENTRGYHIDDAQPHMYKAFVYLTDATDLSCGPYSFVKKSHRFSLHSYVNIIKNLFIKNNRSTDSPWYDHNLVQHCTGKKGTMVMSNQNAIHRGMPQDKGKKRVAIIFSFMIKSKLSYMHKAAKKNLADSKVVVNA